MLHGARFLFSAPPIAAIPSAGTGLEGSWRRCQHEYGLDPATPALPCVLSGAELRQSCQRAGRVMHFAAPELDLLHAALEPVGYTVMLADIGGVVLDHRTAPHPARLPTVAFLARRRMARTRCGHQRHRHLPG
ncbi:hypothetical protein RAA17_09340 [Komagataeibacter rhaeticus]|nr:hypothetical protein [Komagataeibacter rhaeticus]